MVPLSTGGTMKLVRVVYKTPHNIFFRRCWFVKETIDDGDYLNVRHGLRGRITTKIPKAGTIFRLVHRKERG